MGKQLTYADRLKLEALLKAKVSVTEISGILQKSRQTIYNEIKRGAYLHTDMDKGDYIAYSPDKGQKIVAFNRSNHGRELAIGNDHQTAKELKDLIEKSRMSPAAALMTIKKRRKVNFGLSTLYSYIYKGFIGISPKALPRGRRRRKTKVEHVRIRHAALPSIEERPREISRREAPGHWEMDLVIGCKGSKAVLLTMIERLSRKCLIRLLPDRRAATIRGVLDLLELKGMQIETITTDNGSEFLEYEKLITGVNGGKRFEVYYCHPMSAWEKGSIENLNGLIRRWIPKGTNFDELTEEHIREIEEILNSYPRKILGWKTPEEIYLSICA